jgi:hypothetical protein
MAIISSSSRWEYPLVVFIVPGAIGSQIISKGKPDPEMGVDDP